MSSAPSAVRQASQQHIDSSTPMGANLVADGATFLAWAPEALEVHVVLRDGRNAGHYALAKRQDDVWTGFVPGVQDGSLYRFWIRGKGSEGWKRDPWARELAAHGFPDCDCIVRDPKSYPWHDAGFRPPPFHELVIYQLHTGVFWSATEQGRVAKFLDVAARIPYLKDLGINAVQLLPIQEFPYDNSLGYNNVDFFSPEMAYQVEEPDELERYLHDVNAQLAAHGHPALTFEQLAPGPNQLKLLVDLLHLNGIAVLFDLVYNHAGGFGDDDQSLYFFDRRPSGDNNNSLYFTGEGWAGGLVFAYWNSCVRGFLIENAKFFLSEYHVDGFRFDEVSVIDNEGGWSFCQELTAALHAACPGAIQIAEYWNPARELAVQPPPTGMGFDSALSDRLRDALRGALEQANDGAGAPLNLEPVRDALYPAPGFTPPWRAVQYLENHDIVYSDREPHEWKPRIARLADPSNPRSWYARSRARWATSLLLTAPGIPMLFMGQEILEDRNWNDSPHWHRDTLIRWSELDRLSARRDFHAFVRELIHLRRSTPALTGPNVNAYHVNSASRVLAFHRWVDGDDAVIVANLCEHTITGYQVGFPLFGEWREVFNSDFFESDPGHSTDGNAGWIYAFDHPMHGLPASAALTIPANGVVIFRK